MQLNSYFFYIVILSNFTPENFQAHDKNKKVREDHLDEPYALRKKEFVLKPLFIVQLILFILSRIWSWARVKCALQIINYYY